MDHSTAVVHTGTPGSVFCLPVCLTGAITDGSAAVAIRQVQEYRDPVLTLVINTLGGSRYNAFAIYDTIRLAHFEKVRTYARGVAGNAGAILLAAAGTPGYRYITPETRVILRTPLGAPADSTAPGGQTDPFDESEIALLALRTGQSAERIREDCKTGLYLNARQAIEYGLADSIADELPTLLP